MWIARVQAWMVYIEQVILTGYFADWMQVFWKRKIRVDLWRHFDEWLLIVQAITKQA